MRLGYYVHHHGHGHATVANGIVPRLRSEVTVLTSSPVPFPGAEVARLPLDTGPETEGLRPRRLHHAPLHVRGLRERNGRMVRWWTEHEPAAVVVDVSVEVTLLARLCGVPPVLMRLHGDRTDAAHLAGFDAAVANVAPYPAWFEDPSTPDWVRDRTTYVGGFSRFDGRRGSRDVAREERGLDGNEPLVVVVTGAGGGGPDLAGISEAAASTPDHRWRVLGVGPRDVHGPENLDAVGWVDDPYDELLAADVVVAGAGHNTVMEIAAVRRPAILVAEPRPFDEQDRRARLLEDAGLVVRATGGRRWSGLLDEARDLPTGRWGRLVDGCGAHRAARVLDGLADRYAS